MWSILNLTFFQWILSNSFKASVLVIIVLLIKLLFKDKISARIQYLLWLVIVIRLIIPWTTQSPYSIYNLIENENNKLPKISYTVPLDNSNTPQSNEVVPDETKDSTLAVSPTSNFIDKNTIVFKQLTLNNSISEPWTMEKSFIVVWLLGVLVLMIISFVRNRVFARKLDAKQVTKEEMNLTFKNCKDKLRVQANIPLVQTDKVTSPSLYGVFRPMLLLPEQVQDKLSSKQFTYVFVHELVHFKHKDIFVNWLTHFLVILHWFNPLIWFVNYKMREDQELACDEFALSYIGTEQAGDYGLTLLHLLEGYSKTKGITGLASISGSKSQIKRRIEMLKKVSVKWSLLALIVVFIISFAVLTNAKTNSSGKLATKASDQVPIKSSKTDNINRVTQPSITSSKVNPLSQIIEQNTIEWITVKGDFPNDTSKVLYPARDAETISKIAQLINSSTLQEATEKEMSETWIGHGRWPLLLTVKLKDSTIEMQTMWQYTSKIVPRGSELTGTANEDKVLMTVECNGKKKTYTLSPAELTKYVTTGFRTDMPSRRYIPTLPPITITPYIIKPGEKVTISGDASPVKEILVYISDGNIPSDTHYLIDKVSTDFGSRKWEGTINGRVINTIDGKQVKLEKDRYSFELRMGSAGTVGAGIIDLTSCK
jgi:beta-lactamase regulating signal transducer with metallopeptidase domain